MGVKDLPNIQSAKKRVKVIAKKTAHNKSIRSSLKTQLKHFDAAIDANDGTQVQDLYSKTVGKVDSSASKGVIHKNKANRLKAQLAKKLSSVAK